MVQREAREHNLRRDMAEVSHQLQGEGLGGESNSAFISTKARLWQILTDIVEVMKR